MATTVARLEAVLSANTRQFDRAMDRSHTKTERFGAMARTAGLAAGTALATGLVLSVKAAIDAEAAQSRLATAFKTSGLRITPYKKRIDELETASRKLGFADDDTRTSLGSLITATHDYNLAARELAIAQDVARFKGVDLTTATKLLIAAQAGSARATKQLGITLQNVTTQQDEVKNKYRQLTPEQRKATEAVYDHDLALAKLNDKEATHNLILNTVEQRLKGQAEAYAKTSAGGMEQFKAQLNNLEVTIGTKMLPALTKILTNLNNLLVWFQENKQLFQPFLTAAKASLDRFIAPFHIWADVIRGDWKNLWKDLKTFIRALFLVDLWKQLGTYVGKQIWEGLTPWVVAVKTFFKNRIDDIVGFFQAMPARIAAVGKPLVKAMDVIHDAFKGINAAVHALVRGLDKVIDAFKWIINNVKKIGGAIGGIGGAIGGIAGKLNPLGEGGGLAGGGLVGGGNMGQMVYAADRIDKRHFPYLWGGGHSAATMDGPYDCSGAVSAVLRAGGLLTGARVSGDFMSYGKPGLGKRLSILANPEHVYMLINGKAWGTSGQNPGGGAGWFSGGVRPGFAIRHPEGFDAGGWLRPGVTLAINNTGRPERVLGPGEGGNTFVFNIPNYVGSKNELMSWLQNAARQFQNRNGRPAFGGA